MIIYRLTKEKFANQLSGFGAEQSGGRWNSKGVAMIYTSENRSLCTAEIAVHTPLGIMPLDFCLISIEVPDNMKIESLALKDLPYKWREIPPDVASQKVGDAFIRNSKSSVLKVPSVVVQGEYNYLINPNHLDFNKIKIKKIEPFSFDERLFSI